MDMFDGYFHRNPAGIGVRDDGGPWIGYAVDELFLAAFDAEQFGEPASRSDDRVQPASLVIGLYHGLRDRTVIRISPVRGL